MLRNSIDITIRDLEIPENFPDRSDHQVWRYCPSKSREPQLKEWIEMIDQVRDIPRVLVLINDFPLPSIRKHLFPTSPKISHPKTSTISDRLRKSRSQRYASQKLTDHGHTTNGSALAGVPSSTRRNIYGPDHPVLFLLPPRCWNVLHSSCQGLSILVIRLSSILIHSISLILLNCCD